MTHFYVSAMNSLGNSQIILTLVKQSITGLLGTHDVTNLRAV